MGDLLGSASKGRRKRRWPILSGRRVVGNVSNGSLHWVNVVQELTLNREASPDRVLYWWGADKSGATRKEEFLVGHTTDLTLSFAVEFVVLITSRHN